MQVNCSNDIADSNEFSEENGYELNKYRKSLELLFRDNIHQNKMISLILVSLERLQNQIDEFVEYEESVDKRSNEQKSIKRNNNNNINSNNGATDDKRARKQLFSSGLQGVWGIPGKK